MWLCERRSLHVALHKRSSLHVRHCMQAFFPSHRFANELMHYLIAVTSHLRVSTQECEQQSRN